MRFREDQTKDDALGERTYQQETSYVKATSEATPTQAVPVAAQSERTVSTSRNIPRTQISEELPKHQKELPKHQNLNKISVKSEATKKLQTPNTTSGKNKVKHLAPTLSAALVSMGIFAATGLFWLSKDSVKQAIDPSASASSTSSVALPGVSALQAGQCIENWEDVNDNNRQYAVVDCMQAHNAQIFAKTTTLNLSQAIYPGDDVVNSAAEQYCNDQVASTKDDDVDLNSDGISVHWTMPNHDSYNTGDRTAVCFFSSEQPILRSIVKDPNATASASPSADATDQSTDSATQSVDATDQSTDTSNNGVITDQTQQDTTQQGTVEEQGVQQAPTQ
ncbi:MAG: septum formation family protein [Micrococcaceae bacterium]